MEESELQRSGPTGKRNNPFGKNLPIGGRTVTVRKKHPLNVLFLKPKRPGLVLRLLAEICAEIVHLRGFESLYLFWNL